MRTRQARRCKARRSTDGEPCEAYAMSGALVCRSHGGASPQARRGSADRMAAEQALTELSRRGFAPVENPLEALALIAGEILAVKDIFRERVAQLREEAWRYGDAKGGEQLRAEISLYERALDRSAKVLADIARLKIDDRLTAITEQQGQTLAAILTAVLNQLDLTDQADRARELIVIELRKASEQTRVLAG